MKKIIIFFLIGIFCLGFGLWGLNINNQTFVPKEEKVQTVWIPQGAEVRPVSQVVPGTFKINLSFEEFQSTTKPDQTVLVVYDVNISASSYMPATVRYWRSRGDGTFHYATATVNYPKSSFLQLWSFPGFDREAGGYRFVSEKDGWLLSLSIFSMLIGGSIFLFYCCAVLVYAFKRSNLSH